MRFPKLRIAWSVVCGIVCLLLIVLWVRSYWFCDNLGIGKLGISNGHQITTLRGWIFFDEQITFSDSNYVAKYSLPGFLGYSLTMLTIGLGVVTSGDTSIAIPFCLPIMGGVILTATPWLPRRFGLRTLLIGMTLVAVVLGVLVLPIR